MDTWTPSQANPGYLEKTFQHGAATITILRPVLSETENARRTSNTRTALESAMREYITRRQTS